jgi:hypothetical protein
MEQYFILDGITEAQPSRIKDGKRDDSSASRSPTSSENGDELRRWRLGIAVAPYGISSASPRRASPRLAAAGRAAFLLGNGP